MNSPDRTWSEWLKWHLDQTPFQILHMRELAEHTLRAQDTTRDVVSGSSEQDRLPYNAQAADDADQLYVELVLFAQNVSDLTGILAPAPARRGHWRGATEPQGLPVCTPSDAFAWATEIRTWLTNQIGDLEQLTHDGKLGDSPDTLVDTIRDLRRRYPRAEPKFKAYRPQRCPTCGERTILPVWGKNGLEALTCDTCGATRTNPLETAGIATPKPQPESDDPAAPSATGSTKASPPPSTTKADASSEKTTSSHGGETE